MHRARGEEKIVELWLKVLVFSGVKNILKLIMEIVTQFCEWGKLHSSVNVSALSCTLYMAGLCGLFINKAFTKKTQNKTLSVQQCLVVPSGGSSAG